MTKLLERARRGGLGRLALGAIVMGLVIEVAIVWTVAHSAPENFWFIFVPVGGFFALLGGGLFVNGWRIWRRPLRHPRFAGMRDTDAEMNRVLAGLERDLPSPNQFSLLGATSVQLTDECLVTRKIIVNLRHLLWVFPQETSRSVNHLPLGTTRDLALYTNPAGGHYDEPLVLILDDAEALMNAIVRRAPWAFVGEQPRWGNLWTEVREELAQRVRERRDKPPA
ncbi:MAG: hypothetical protein ACI9KE_001878 [Polyangiales bacterium]|jgi:hypothetical protein